MFRLVICFYWKSALQTAAINSFHFINGQFELKALYLQTLLYIFFQQCRYFIYRCIQCSWLRIVIIFFYRLIMHARWSIIIIYNESKTECYFIDGTSEMNNMKRKHSLIAQGISPVHTHPHSKFKMYGVYGWYFHSLLSIKKKECPLNDCICVIPRHLVIAFVLNGINMISFHDTHTVCCCRWSRISVVRLLLSVRLLFNKNVFRSLNFQIQKNKTNERRL